MYRLLSSGQVYARDGRDEATVTQDVLARASARDRRIVSLLVSLGSRLLSFSGRRCRR
jgi:hypothetical protein